MRIVIILCVLLLAASTFADNDQRRMTVTKKDSDGSKRVALVIGNSTYTNSPLKNPVNDAKDIATKLRKLGFVVIERNNLTTREIGGTLQEFRSKLEPGAVALFFYAGHGLQIKGDNYLPAVDANINSEYDVPNQSLAMRQIMDVLDESKSRLNLVFLDACRNNPYARSFRSSDRGLARVTAPSGTLISYATKPGSVAADGTGRNGLYTSKLLAQIDSNQQIEQTLKRVVTEVKAASNGKQEPWMEGSIEGDFCFGGCTMGDGQPLPVTLPSQVTDAETEVWGIVKETADAEVVRDFLKEYPNGKYASPARFKLKELESKTRVAMAPRPQPATENSTAADDGFEFEKAGFKFYKDVVVDTRAGLMWTRNGNIADKYMSWDKAMSWARNLNYGGYRDWRLPTVDELASFAKRGGNHPSEWFNENGFNSVRASYYWSSSTYAEPAAHSVYMYGGGVLIDVKSKDYYVWPVRDSK